MPVKVEVEPRLMPAWVAAPASLGAAPGSSVPSEIRATWLPDPQVTFELHVIPPPATIVPDPLIISLEATVMSPATQRIPGPPKFIVVWLLRIRLPSMYQSTGIPPGLAIGCKLIAQI